MLSPILEEDSHTTYFQKDGLLSCSCFPLDKSKMKKEYGGRPRLLVTCLTAMSSHPSADRTMFCPVTQDEPDLVYASYGHLNCHCQ